MSAIIAATLVMVGLTVGCGDSGLGPPDKQMLRDLEACGEHPNSRLSSQLAGPPGTYLDHGMTLDYARMAPKDHPKHGDGDYIARVVRDQRMLEQVYADAARGQQRPRWLVCLFEAGMRGAARDAAARLAGLRCQSIPNCRFQPDALPFSDTTASGARVLTLIAEDFEAEARRRQVAHEVLGHMLALSVGTRVLGARLKAGPIGPAGKPSIKPTGSGTAAKPAGSGPAAKPAGSGTAASATKSATKPRYRTFTRANFRYNLAQRTGGIPSKAQAHHALPMKFEDRCRKAGINIHEPRFGVWWKARDHRRKAWAYNARWEKWFSKHKNPTAAEILHFGRETAKDFGLAIAF